MKYIADNVYMSIARAADVAPLVCKYHYSRCMPRKVQYCFAVRKTGGFFGTDGEVLAGLVFGEASGCWKESVMELKRVIKKPDFDIQLSQLIAYACKQLKRLGCPLIISYADRMQGHHGGLYQACGWLYHGRRKPLVDGFYFNEKFVFKRTCNAKFGTSSLPKLIRKLPMFARIEPRMDEGKHLYWRPLSKAGYEQAARIKLISSSYPKPDLENGGERSTYTSTCNPRSVNIS